MVKRTHKITYFFPALSFFLVYQVLMRFDDTMMICIHIYIQLHFFFCIIDVHTKKHYIVNDSCPKCLFANRLCVSVNFFHKYLFLFLSCLLVFHFDDPFIFINNIRDTFNNEKMSLLFV